MKAHDRPNFVQLIVEVYKFYRVDTSEFALNIWWQAMHQFELPALNDAFGRHVSNPDNGQFIPKPADIVRMLQGSTVDTALEAWTKVERAIRSVGPYQSVCFDDALINSILSQMGGWVQVCSVGDDELPFRRNEFVTRHRGYTMRNERPEYPRYLLGIAETQNVSSGKAIEPPMMIGCQEKANKIYQSGVDKSLFLAKPFSQTAKPKQVAA